MRSLGLVVRILLLFFNALFLPSDEKREKKMMKEKKEQKLSPLQHWCRKKTSSSIAIKKSGSSDQIVFV